MDLTGFEPKYITFDCYGALTNFQLGEAVRPLVADLNSSDDMEPFLKDFRAYRLDEVVGAYRPYKRVNRGYGPSVPYYGYAETDDLAGVPKLLAPLAEGKQESDEAEIVPA